MLYNTVEIEAIKLALRNLELYSSAARERLIYGMAKKCSEELSDMLWKK